MYTKALAKTRRACDASISVICGFLNQFSVPLLKHNLGAKPCFPQIINAVSQCIYPVLVYGELKNRF